MDTRIQVHVEIDTRIVANREPEGFWLNVGEELVIFFAAGGEGSRPEAVAAITDRMIEQLMGIREAALRQAVREGDRKVVDELERSTLRSLPPALALRDGDDPYVRGLGRPPRQLPIDHDLEEATKADHELMRDEFHGRGIDGSL